MDLLLTRRASIILLLSPLLLLSVGTSPVVAQPALLIEKSWGGSEHDFGMSIALDPQGYTYVTGRTSSFGAGSPGVSDAILLKYDRVGDLVWQKIWGGTGSESGSDVSVDSAGNILVAGHTNSSGAGGLDVALLKIDPSASLFWQKTWGGSNNEVAKGITVDSSGSIYVTGYTRSFGAGAADVFLLKFNSSGILLWQHTWGGDNLDFGVDVATDSIGNIYVVGNTYSFGSGIGDTFLLKFSPDGNLLWQKIWGGNFDDVSIGVALDSSGGIYAAGSTCSFGAGDCDAFVLKFDSTSGLIWKRTWGGSGDEHAWHVATHPSGTIYITGYTQSFGAGSSDAFLLRIDSLGSLLTGRTFGGTSEDVGFSVTVDVDENALIAGYAGAPPYTLGSGNTTLATPGGAAIGTGNSTLGNPLFLAGLADGILGTPLGSETYEGGADVLLFKYGLLPTVTFNMSPSAGGSITLNGTSYTHGQSANLTYGNYSATATPAAGFTFTGWSSTGGVSVANTSNNPTTITISGLGTLTASFMSSAPLTPTIFLLTSLATSTLLILRKHQRR